MIEMIDDLPEECLEHIFSFLPIRDRLNIEKVSQRWWNISKRGWKEIKDVELGKDYDNNETHLILKRCGRYVKKLDLFINEKSLNWIPMFMKFCQLDQVEEINIYFSKACASTSKLIRDALKNLFIEAKNVTRVEVETDSEVHNFAYLDAMPPGKLQSLKIMCGSESESGLLHDVLRFPNLEILICKNMRFMNLEGKNYDGAVFKHKIIRLWDCTIDRSLIEKFQFFTELEELVFTGETRDIRDEDIRAIAKNCTKLELLMADDSDITSNCYSDIGKMPSLEYFHLGLSLMIKNTLEIKYLTNVKELIVYDIIGEILRNRDGLLQCISHSQNLQKLSINRIGIGIDSSIIDSFLKDVKEVFESGQRTIPLSLNLEFVGFSEEPKKTVLMHPLLTVTFTYYYLSRDSIPEY